jgi:hypothetical protein
MTECFVNPPGCDEKKSLHDLIVSKFPKLEIKIKMAKIFDWTRPLVRPLDLLETSKIVNLSI